MGIIKQKSYLQACYNSLIINPKDGSVLVKIPGGEYEMGDGKESSCPKHRVYVDTYYMGIYSITNKQYKKFVDSTGHRPPDAADWGTAIWSKSNFPKEYSDHPVVCVSHEDAIAYSTWAGLSLPTEAQWEKAARGLKGYLYPWGNDWDAKKCRNEGNKGSGTTSAVYGYPEGVSGYGCMNMSGNVWEWCMDWYDSNYYTNSPPKNPRGPDKGADRVRRGGSWLNSAPDRFRGASRNFDSPSDRDDNRGFRCACACA